MITIAKTEQPVQPTGPGPAAGRVRAGEVRRRPQPTGGSQADPVPYADSDETELGACGNAVGTQIGPAADGGSVRTDAGRTQKQAAARARFAYTPNQRAAIDKADAAFASLIEVERLKSLEGRLLPLVKVRATSNRPSSAAEASAIRSQPKGDER
jgi:hypothetical protein